MVSRSINFRRTLHSWNDGVNFGSEPTTEGPAYVLFDAARVPNTIHMLDAFHLQYQCLFIGDNISDMADVAPYLAFLVSRDCQGRDFLLQILENGHGICLRSDLPIDQLRRHLKKYLKIRIDSGFVYVKYYLPQNFEFILGTSTILDNFFSDVSSVTMSDMGFDRQFVRIAVLEA